MALAALLALKNGKRTGVVTTDVLSGATPMVFSAHYNDRDASAELLASAANSGVNLFISTTKECSAFVDKSGNAYESIANIENISESQSNYVIGGYSISASASSMSASSSAVAFDKAVSEALEYLSKDPDGFVLMAEGARIDKAGHNSDFNQMFTGVGNGVPTKEENNKFGCVGSIASVVFMLPLAVSAYILRKKKEN